MYNKWCWWTSCLKESILAFLMVTWLTDGTKYSFTLLHLLKYSCWHKSFHTRTNVYCKSTKLFTTSLFSSKCTHLVYLHAFCTCVYRGLWLYLGSPLMVLLFRRFFVVQLGLVLCSVSWLAVNCCQSVSSVPCLQ